MAQRLRPIQWPHRNDGYDINTPLLTQARCRDAGVMLPGERELLLDLDSPAALVEFDERFQMLREMCPGVARHIWKSRTKGHYHVSVTFPPTTPVFTPTERLAYEMALGSDTRRGFYGLYRIETDRAHESSVLFAYHPKYQHATTEEQLTEMEADDDDLPA